MKIYIFICMIGIYKITSPNGKIYIGSSNDIENRFCKYKNLKCENQSKLFNSLKKYGFEEHKFEIIEECDVKILLERELYYGILFEVLDKKKGLNCRLPKSGEHYIYMSEETKRKIGESNKIKNIGKKHNFYESKLKKLTIKEVVEIKNLLIENELTQKQIGDLYGVSRKIINNINIGKTYSSIGKDINLSKSQKLYVKLEISDYDKIKELHNSRLSKSEIAKIFNVHQSHICRIINDDNYIKTKK